MSEFDIDPEKDTLLLYYSETCPHCKVFIEKDEENKGDIWKKLTKNKDINERFNMVKIESGDEDMDAKIKEIADTYEDPEMIEKIKNESGSVPTLKLISKKNVKEYVNEREVKPILEWLGIKPDTSGGSKKVAKRTNKKKRVPKNHQRRTRGKTTQKGGGFKRKTVGKRIMKQPKTTKRRK